MRLQSESGSWNFLQSQRKTSGFSRSIPVFLSILCIFIQVAPLPGPQGISVMPSFILAVIFFWAVLREDRLSFTTSFCLGCLQDLLSGTPLGLWGVTLLGVHLYISSQAHILATTRFMTTWISFAVVSFAAYGFIYLGVFWHIGSPYDFSLVFLPYITTLAIFPLMVRILGFFEDRLSTISGW